MVNNLKNRINSLHKETGSLTVKELCETAQARLSEINEMRVTREASEELKNNILQTLINGIKNVSDDAAKDFVVRESRYLGIRNLGVRESISRIRNSDVSAHPSLLYIIAQFESATNTPEYMVAENYCKSMESFIWHPIIKESVGVIQNNINKYREDISIHKSLFELKNSSSSYILSGIKESLDEFMNSRTKVSRIKLVEKLNKFNFDPLIRNLLNTVNEVSDSALNVKSYNAGSEVHSIYSPVIVTEQSEIFSVSGRIFEKTGTNLKLLNEAQINRLDPSFISLASFLANPSVRVSEGKVTVYTRDKKVEITNESLKINDKPVSMRDFTSVYMNAGVFRREELSIMKDITNVLENFNSIVEIDFAKRIETPNIGNRSVDVIKLNEQIYIVKTDPHMGRIDFYPNINATQAKNLVLEFMNFDITKTFTSLLNEEDAKLNVIKEHKKEYLATINKLEEKLEELQSNVIDTDIRESAEFKQIIDALIEEIDSIKEEYAELVAQEHSITTVPPTRENEGTPTTNRVYVKDLGLEGTVIGETPDSIRVLLDNGKTHECSEDGVEFIESSITGLDEAKIEIKVNGQKIDVHTNIEDEEEDINQEKEDKPDKKEEPKKKGDSSDEEEPKKKSGKSKDTEEDEEELDFSALESELRESSYNNPLIYKIASELQKREKAARFINEDHFNSKDAAESTDEFVAGDRIETEDERYGTVQGVNKITGLVTVALDDGETLELEPAKMVIIDDIDEGAFWPKSDLPDSFESLLKSELNKAKLSGIYYVEGLDLFREDNKGNKQKIMTIDKDKDSVDDIIQNVYDFEEDNINEDVGAGDEVELDDGQRAMVQGIDDNTGFLIVLTDKGETLHVPGNTVDVIVDNSGDGIKEDEEDEEVEGQQSPGSSVDYKE